MCNMKKIDTQTRVRVVNCLIEGVGVSATCRMTGASKNTILKLLTDMGEVCAEFLDKNVRGVKARRVHCDGIWSFCHSKERNVPQEPRGPFGSGSVWTWVGIDAESKLMVSYLVGLRDADTAKAFIDDLAARLHELPQLTIDGVTLYVEPMSQSLGEFVDCAMLAKPYGPGNDNRTASRYSLAECIGPKNEPIKRESDMKHISTSYIERQNLTIRMMNRRFTRLTYAISKKIENHVHAFAIYAFHYNYVHIHQTLKVTPAMAAGLTDRHWNLQDMIELLEAKERRIIGTEANRRGPYNRTSRGTY